jgi:hypothetical protein
MNKLLHRKYSAKGQHNFFEKLLRQSVKLANQRNAANGYPAEEFPILDKLEGTRVKVAGERTTFLEIETCLTLKKTLKISKFFYSWPEAYLTSLRVIEDETEKPDLEDVQTLKSDLYENFENLTFLEFSNLVENTLPLNINKKFNEE